MNLAEALTAAAFLRDDGQFLAVGDHRQMPPILQHAWDQASRRDLARARPHLVWSKNANAPFPQSIRSSHHPLLLLHYTLMCTILISNEW
jgi:hypothetical protein